MDHGIPQGGAWLQISDKSDGRRTTGLGNTFHCNDSWKRSARSVLKDPNGFGALIDKNTGD